MRRSYNRGKRLGWRFDFYKIRIEDLEIERQIQEVSDEWLEEKIFW
jgi:lysylphosphatidylglycerol synthetase-like protein (DUF2156 family)